MLLNIGQIFSSACDGVASSMGLRNPSVDSVFRKALFSNGPAMPKSSPLLSGMTMGATSVVSDYTSLYRGGQDLAVGIWNHFPNSPLSFLRDFVSCKDVSLGYHAFGTASALNTVVGLVQLKGSFEQYRLAQAIGDTRAKLTGKLSCVKAGALFGAGVSFAAYRPLSVIATAKGASSGSLLGRLNQVFAYAGLAFYSLFFTMFTAILGLRVAEGNHFVQKLDRAGDLPAKIQWLQKTLKIEPARVHQKLIETHGADKASELLIEEALRAGKSQIQEMIQELNLPKFSEEKLTEIVKDALKKQIWGFTEGSIERGLREKLMLMGLELKVEKAQLKQSKKMERILGKAGFDALVEVKSLQGRVSIVDQKAEELVEKIRSNANGKMTENGQLMATCALGIVAMVTAMLFTSGIPLIVASAIMLVFELNMIVIDGYSLYQSYQNETPATHDKKMLALSTAVGLASFMSMVALGVSGIVSFGVFPMVVATILTALWMGQNGATYLIMERNEAKEHLKNPTLEIFLKALEDKEQKERVMEMFSHLPEPVKKQIQAALKDHENDMEKAARSVAKKVEETKREH